MTFVGPGSTAAHRRAPFHLCYCELREHLGELDCGRIILTHMTTEMIEAEGGEFERAFDGLAVTL